MILASDRPVDSRLLSFLCFGYFPDIVRGRALYEEFRDSLDLEHYRRHHPSDLSHIGALLAERITVALDRVAGSSIGMGLSAGLDSRVIYHDLRRRGVDVGLYCFGTPGMVDSDFISVLAPQLGLKVESVRTDRMDLDVPRMLKGARELQDFLPSPRLMTIEAMQSRNQVELHGFLNDTMTGNTRLPAEKVSWGEICSRAARQDDAFGFQQYFPGQARHFLPADPFCADQDLSCWDQTQLFFRHAQRFRIPDPAGRRLFPMESGDWAGFWYSRRHDERLGQRLYLRFLRSLGSPVFFDIAASGALTRKELGAWQRRLLYGTPGSPGVFPADHLAGGVPPGSDGHFCAVSCFHQNPVFREACVELVAALEARGVLRRDFITSVMQQVRQRRKGANRNFKGLVSLELALVAGLIDPG